MFDYTSHNQTFDIYLVLFSATTYLLCFSYNMIKYALALPLCISIFSIYIFKVYNNLIYIWFLRNSLNLILLVLL